MRAVLQRVISARVEVEGRIVSQIGPGLLVLVGVLESDTDVDAEFICRKILNTRIFNNEQTGKPWDQNVMQKGYEVLLVSQFTLYGQLKGNKVDFHVAMPPERAKPFYESFVQRVQKTYKEDAVKDGIFGAMMQVHLVNDGPVTIQLESAKKTSMEVNQSWNGFVGDCEIARRRSVVLPRARLNLGPLGLILSVDTLKAKIGHRPTLYSCCRSIRSPRTTTSVTPLAACSSRNQTELGRKVRLRPLGRLLPFTFV